MTAGLLNGPLLDNGDGKCCTGNFGYFLLLAQLVVMVLFLQAELKLDGSDTSALYNFYVGVALMMFVGFGYLMTFLKSFGLGAVGFTMLITCFGAEWSLLFENLVANGSVQIDFLALLNAMFCVAAILISFGAMIGRTSPTQILVLVVLETIFYTLNKIFVLGQYQEPTFVADAGGTIIIHVFGAYFGLAASRMLGAGNSDALDGSSYNSDIFSLVGTVFLWLFWPSFVAGPLPVGNEQTTALINVVIALLASAVVTFAVAPLLDTQKRLLAVPVQNATLAGGVAIGVTANLVTPPMAIVIGTAAGAISTVGFVKSSLFSGLDTCGIHNPHGMPGVFGALVSVLVPVFYSNANVVFWHQLIGLVATLVVAGITGSLTGFIMKKVDQASFNAFDDAAFWETADDIIKAE